MEDKLRKSLDNFNEEQTDDLLDKDIDFDVDKKAVKRIKASVNKKIRKNKKPAVFSRKFAAFAAAIILVFCTMTAVGFDNIAAAIQQIVEYIPGFGKVPEDDRMGMLDVKVMKKPAFVEVKGEKVEIYSCWISIYKDQAIVTTILRYPQNLKLDGEIAIEYNGEKIYRDSEHFDYSTLNSKDKVITYEYTIKNPKDSIKNLTFVTEESKADIAFEKSEDIKDKVISENFDGIILSAIPLNENRSKFILTSTYDKNIDGVRFLSSFTTGIDSEMKAIDEAGNEYEIKKSTSQGSEYYVDGDIKGKIVSLKFNKLYQGFVYEKNNSLLGIKFKTPKAGEKVNVDGLLDNNLCSINLKTVEKNSKEPEKIVFTYKIKSKIPALDISYIALYVEKTGGVKGNSVLEMNKQGDGYVVNHEVIADKNAEANTVTIVAYPGGYYWNTLLLDKECILNLQ